MAEYFQNEILKEMHVFKTEVNSWLKHDETEMCSLDVSCVHCPITLAFFCAESTAGKFEKAHELQLLPSKNSFFLFLQISPNKLKQSLSALGSFWTTY